MSKLYPAVVATVLLLTSAVWAEPLSIEDIRSTVDNNVDDAISLYREFLALPNDALHPDVSAPWTALRRIGDCVAGVDGSRGAAGSRSPGGRPRSLSPGPSFPRSARPTNISAGLSVVEAD